MRERFQAAAAPPRGASATSAPSTIELPTGGSQADAPLRFCHAEHARMEVSSQEDDSFCDALEDAQHDADNSAAVPVWQMPEAVDWCLAEPFSIPACLLPTATDVLEGYPRSLRFLSRVLGRLLVTQTRMHRSRHLSGAPRRSGREDSSSSTGSDTSADTQSSATQPGGREYDRSKGYGSAGRKGVDNFAGPPRWGGAASYRDGEAFSGPPPAPRTPRGLSQEGGAAPGHDHVGDSRWTGTTTAENSTGRQSETAAPEGGGTRNKTAHKAKEKAALNRGCDGEGDACEMSFTGLFSGRVAKALRAVHQVVQSLDFALWLKLHNLLRRPNDMHALQSFLLDITVKLKTLPLGGTAFLPGGVALAADKRPVFLLFVVHRQKRTTPVPLTGKPVATFARGVRSTAVLGGAGHPSAFVFAVVNASGFGTEFHAFRLERHPCPGSVQRDLLLVFQDVDAEHLLHSSFWYAVYRVLLVPSPMNLHTLYTVILPHLNRKPLLHNWLFPSAAELDIPFGASVWRGLGSVPSPARFVCLSGDSAAVSDVPAADSHQSDGHAAVTAHSSKGQASDGVGWLATYCSLPPALLGAKSGAACPSTEAADSSAALVNPSTLGGCWRPAPQLRTSGSCIQGVQAALLFMLRCYGLPEWEVVAAELYVHFGFCALLLDDIRRLPSPPPTFPTPPGPKVGSASSGEASSLQKAAAAAAGAWLSLQAASSFSYRQQSGSCSSVVYTTAIAAAFPFLRPQALLVSFAVRRLARLASDFAWSCGVELQYRQQLRDWPLGAACVPALEQKAADTLLRVPQLRTDHYTQVHRLLRQLRQEGVAKLPLECRGLGSGSCALPPHACTPGLKVRAAAAFPLFGRFRLDVPSPEALAGEPAEPPLLLPVDLSAAAERVEDIEDVVRVLRKTVEACVLLGNQQHLMPHTFCFRFQLIVHLLLRVVPLPLPPTHRLVSQSFWHAVALRRETQIELLRLLHALTRHFACTFFSLPNSRSADAERLIAMAVLCCLADCVLRIPAAGGAGEASTLSLFYSGEADGPVQPFAFDITAFAEESSFLLLYDPIYSTARTQVLDYFNAWRETVPEERIIFAWEKEAEVRLGKGDAALLELLAVHWGFDRSRDALELYFSGERPELLDFFPELLYVRDIVFFFKALMTPAADALPALRRWGVAEATLHWRLDAHKGHYVVTAFQKQLHCRCFGKEDDYYQQPHQTKKRAAVSAQQTGGRAHLLRAASAGGGAGATALTAAGGATCGANQRIGRQTSLSSPKAAGGTVVYSSNSSSGGSATHSSRARLLFQRLFYWLGAGEKPRAPPSGADPSNLLPAASRAAGERIMCEEDVLHIKKLPTFGGRLKPQDSELLLQFLTAPYLRIPLVLQFFTEDSRADALVAPALQHVLTATLFEPWHFQHEEVKLPPEVVPPPNQDYLATPLGLLFNELQCSPNTLLSSLAQLLDIAIDKDSGSYRGPSATILLFTLRLVARVQSYVLFILRHERYWRTQTAGAPQYASESSKIDAHRFPAAGDAGAASGERLLASGGGSSAATACLSSHRGSLIPPPDMHCPVHKTRGRWEGWRIPTVAEAATAARKRERYLERHSRRRGEPKYQEGDAQGESRFSPVDRTAGGSSSNSLGSGVTGTTAHHRPNNAHDAARGDDASSGNQASRAALHVPAYVPSGADALCCCRKPASLSVSRNGWAAQVRGLHCRNAGVLKQLRQWRRRLQRRLHGELLHLLERWADKAVADGDIEAACRLHAHITLLFQDYLWEDLNAHSVATFLTSLFFVFTHHNFDVELPPELHSGETVLSVERHASRAAAARGVAAGGNAPACAAAAGAASAGLSRPRSAGATGQHPGTSGRGLGKNPTQYGSSPGAESSGNVARWVGMDYSGGTTMAGKSRPDAVGSHHTQPSDDFGDAIFGSDPLGISDMSLFQLLQQHRLQMLRWLQAHPGDQGSNAVLEAIVRTATFTGSRTTQRPQERELQHRQLPAAAVTSRLSHSRGGRGPYGPSRGTAAPPSAATAAPGVITVAREWTEVTGGTAAGCGRFAPVHVSRNTSITECGRTGEPAAKQPLQKGEQSCSGAAGTVGATVGMVAAAERTARAVGYAAADAVASVRRFVGGGDGKGKSAGGDDEKARQRGAQMYAEWLRRHVGSPADTEINLQVAELTLRRNPLEMLGTWTNEFDDFLYLFGTVSADSSFQAALVNSTSERLWCRLVGPRHDLQRWHPPRDTGAFFAHAVDGFSRIYTGANCCSPEEATWVPQLLDPWIQEHLPHSANDVVLLMQEPRATQQQKQMQEPQQMVRLLWVCGYRLLGDGGSGGGVNTACTGAGSRGGGTATTHQQAGLGMPFFARNPRAAAAPEDAAVGAAAACGALEPLAVAAGELGAQALGVATLPLISQYQPLDLDDVAALVAAASEAEDYHAGGGAAIAGEEGVAAFLLSGAAAAVTELSVGMMRNPSSSSSVATDGRRGGSQSPSSSHPRSNTSGAAGRLWSGSSSSGAQQEGVFCILKEIVLRRWPPLLEVYNIVEHGRRLYRQLCYASDARLTYDAAADKRLDERPLACLAGTTAPAAGLHQRQRDEQLYNEERDLDTTAAPDDGALLRSPDGHTLVVNSAGSCCNSAHASWLYNPRLCLGVPAAVPLTGWNVGPCAGFGAAAAFNQNCSGAGGLLADAPFGGRKSGESRAEAESSTITTAVAAASAAAGEASRYVLAAARAGRDGNDETANLLLSRVAVAPSLVVLRHIRGSASGQREEHYIPTRFLRGLMPFCLLEEYEFWQSTNDGIIRGFPRQAMPGNTSRSQQSSACSVLYIHLVYASPPYSERGLSCQPEAAAVIQRVPVKPPQNPDSVAAGTAAGPAATSARAASADVDSKVSEPAASAYPPRYHRHQGEQSAAAVAEAATRGHPADGERATADAPGAAKERYTFTRRVSGAEGSSVPPGGGEDDEQLLCWDEALTLLNLQQATPGSPLAALAETMRRVEELSYTLFWSSSGRRPGGVEDEEALNQPLSIDLIELPRLGLTFRAQQPVLPRAGAARPAPSGGEGTSEAPRAGTASSSTSGTRRRAGPTVSSSSLSMQSPTVAGAASSTAASSAVTPVLTKYFCEQHNNLFLSTGDVLRSPLTARLVSGLPHSLLLANDEGDLFVLTAATVKPYRIFRRSSPVVLAAVAAPTSSALVAGSQSSGAQGAAQQSAGSTAGLHSPTAAGGSREKGDAASSESQNAAGEAAATSSPAAGCMGRLKGSSAGGAHEGLRRSQRTDRRTTGMAGRGGSVGGERVVEEAEQLLDLLEPSVVHDFSDRRWLRGLSVGGGISCHHYLYPVHSSRSFLFTPTVAGGLHLLLMRYLARQYEEVCRLADAACFAAEARLSPEELQLWGAIGALDRQPDRHPDAHAARLRIWLAANQHDGMYALTGEAASVNNGADECMSEQPDGAETGVLPLSFLRKNDVYTQVPTAAGRKGKGAESGAGTAARQTSSQLRDAKSRHRNTRFARWRPATHLAGLGKSARASLRAKGAGEKEENEQQADTSSSEDEEGLLTDSAPVGCASKTEPDLREEGAAPQQQKPQHEREEPDRNHRDAAAGRKRSNTFTPTSSRLRLLRWAVSRRRKLLKHGAVFRAGAARGVCCWDMPKDLLAYVQKLRYVSAACRLALEEEYELLKLVPPHIQALPEVANRVTVLAAMLRHSSGDKSSRDSPSTSSSGTPTTMEERVSGMKKVGSSWKARGTAETLHEGEARDTASTARSSEDSVRQELFAYRDEGEGDASSTLDPLLRVDGLQLPSVPHVDDFDAVADRSCLKAEASTVESLLESCSNVMSSFALRRAENEPLQGAAALSFVHKWLEKGVRLSDFLVLYELLTNAQPLQVLPGESPHIWGALLTRMLPTWDLRAKSRTVSTLRVLMANPAVASCFPQLQEDGRRGAAARLPLGSVVFRTQEPFQKLLKDIQQALFDLQRSGKLLEPVALPGGLLRKIPNHVFVWHASSWLNRLAVCVNVEDYACERRTLEPVDSAQYAHALTVFNAEQQQLLLPASATTAQQQPQLQQTTRSGAFTMPAAAAAAAATPAPEEVGLTAAALEAFASQPLQILDLEHLVYWEQEDTRERGAAAAKASQSNLPFSLDHHPAAQSSIGKSTIKRLQHEVQAYEEQLANTRAPCLKGFSSAEVVEMLTSPAALARVVRFLAHLRQRLCAYFVADGRFVDRTIRLTAAVANAVPAFNPFVEGSSSSGTAAGDATAAAGRCTSLETNDGCLLTAQRHQPYHHAAQQEGHGDAFKRGHTGTAAKLNPCALEQLKWAFALGRLGGLEITLSFEYLVALLMSSNAENCMRRLNPFLTTAMVRDVFSLVGGVMLAVNRRAQLCRCLCEVVGLMRLIKKHTAAATGLRSAAVLDATCSAARAAATTQGEGAREVIDNGKRSDSFLARMVTCPASKYGAAGAVESEGTSGAPSVGNVASSSATASNVLGEHQRKQSLHEQHKPMQQQRRFSAVKQLQFLPPPSKSVVLMLRVRARAVAEQLVAERACLRVAWRGGRSSVCSSAEQQRLVRTAGEPTNSHHGGDSVHTLFDSRATPLTATNSSRPGERDGVSRRGYGLEDGAGRASSVPPPSSRAYSSTLCQSSSLLLEYDPRYLVFEFAYNLLLRRGQVELIETFRRHASAQQSLCHQMIMGAGKTTVLAPLLALLLADGHRLVAEVTPHTLLEFTRSVLRERFSAIIRKGVLTLRFSRSDNVDEQLYLKLLQARDARAVVIMTPTTLKSFLLKALQLLHVLDVAWRANEFALEISRLSDIDKVVHAGRSQLQKLQAGFCKLLGFKQKGDEGVSDLLLGLDGVALAAPERLSVHQLRACRRELSLCFHVLNLFSSGVLLIDEVDQILHPLRSELHWPVGRKQPLDLTRETRLASAAVQPQGQQQQLVHSEFLSVGTAATGATVAVEEGAAAGLTALKPLQRLHQRRLASGNHYPSAESEQKWRRSAAAGSVADACGDSTHPLGSSTMRRNRGDFVTDRGAAPATTQHPDAGACCCLRAAGGRRGSSTTKQTTCRTLFYDEDEGVGLRWKLPWHLLDALFFCYEQRMTVPLTKSREAWRLLKAIQDTVAGGVAQRALQTMPHLVLLSRQWYEEHLKLLLARWLLLALIALRFTGLSDENALRYMTLPVEVGPSAAARAEAAGRDAPPTLGAAEYLMTARAVAAAAGNGDLMYMELFEAVENLPEAHVKLLNLSREWLNSLLPHILQKTNRVSYGVMTTAEVLQQLRESPTLPRSRQLLAVPFVGKDTPSVASEFSHPDVAIGLTILSYRYQGLRFFDVMCVLQEQQERLEGGYGSQHTRVAAKEFAEWVEAAGGLIRGNVRVHRRPELQQLLQEAVLMGQQQHHGDSCSVHKRWKDKRKKKYGRIGETEGSRLASRCDRRSWTQLQRVLVVGCLGSSLRQLEEGVQNTSERGMVSSESHAPLVGNVTDGHPNSSARKTVAIIHEPGTSSGARRANSPENDHLISSCTSNSSDSGEGSVASDTTITSWEEDGHSSSTCSSKISSHDDERRQNRNVFVCQNAASSSGDIPARDTDGWLLQTQGLPFAGFDMDGPHALHSSQSDCNTTFVDGNRSPRLAAGGRLARGLRKLRRKSSACEEASPAVIEDVGGGTAAAARGGGQIGERTIVMTGNAGQRYVESARSSVLSGRPWESAGDSSSGGGLLPSTAAGLPEEGKERQLQRVGTYETMTHHRRGRRHHRWECCCAERHSPCSRERRRARSSTITSDRVCPSCSPMCMDCSEHCQGAAIVTHEYPPDVEEHLGDAEEGVFFSEASLREADAVLFRKIWPLEIIDLHDPEHADCLYRLLWREPLVVAAYLFRVVFPTTLEYAAQQLSASGQEVGGSILFPVRLGFSGTPSDLLPVELGRCQYEAGTDGKMLKLLTDPNVVSYEILEEGWTVESLLDRVAAAVRGNAGSSRRLRSDGGGSGGSGGSGFSAYEEQQQQRLHGRSAGAPTEQRQNLPSAERRCSTPLCSEKRGGEESEEAEAPFLALIDTGALITGKSNVEVAATLLQRGLGDIEGVVFLDQLDRQMVLLRENCTVMKLAQCGVALEKRFTFYDHVHTTGQARSTRRHDIKQAADATAFLTLGKDSTFRGYAQGGWRMRGIGRGQKIHLLIPPEITELVVRHARLAQTLRYDECLFPSVDSFLQQERQQYLAPQQQRPQPQPPSLVGAAIPAASGLPPTCTSAAAAGGTTTGSATTTSGGGRLEGIRVSELSPNAQEAWRAIVCRGLREICGWLVARGIAEESLQLRLLYQQNLSNIWRKRALARLREAHQQIGTAGASLEVVHCLNVFREKVEFSIPTHVPAMPSLLQRLQLLADEQAELLPLTVQDHREIEHVLSVLQQEESDLRQRRLRAAAVSGVLLPGPGGGEDALRTEAMEAEVEHEQEQEQEKEQEQEQEVEQEKEEEQVPDAEEAAEALKYSRQDQEPHAWLLRTLAAPPDRRAQGFYPCAEFSVMHKLLQTGVTMPFPEFLLISENHYRPSWRQNSYRRLKNVIIVMEWLPEYGGAEEGDHPRLKSPPARVPASGGSAVAGAASGAAAAAAAAAASVAAAAVSVAAAVTGRDPAAQGSNEDSSQQQWERVQCQRRSERQQRLLDIFSWMDPTHSGYIDMADAEEVLRALFLNARDTAAGLSMEGELLVQVVLQRLQTVLFSRYRTAAPHADEDPRKEAVRGPLPNREGGLQTAATTAEGGAPAGPRASAAVGAAGIPTAAAGSETATRGWDVVSAGPQQGMQQQEHLEDLMLFSPTPMMSAAASSAHTGGEAGRLAAAADRRFSNCSNDPLAALFALSSSSSSSSSAPVREAGVPPPSGPVCERNLQLDLNADSFFPALTPLQPAAVASSSFVPGTQQAGWNLLSEGDSISSGGQQQQMPMQMSPPFPVTGRPPAPTPVPPPYGEKAATLQVAPDFLDSILTSPLRAEDTTASPATSRPFLPSSRSDGSRSLLPGTPCRSGASVAHLRDQDAAGSTRTTPGARQPSQHQQTSGAELLSLASIRVREGLSAASSTSVADAVPGQHTHAGGRQQQQHVDRQQHQPEHLRVSLSDLAAVLSDQLLFDVDPCRYFVILTLEEAEGVRAALHAMQYQQQQSASVVPGRRCAVALRNLSAHLQTIDASPLLTNWSEKVASVVGEQPQIAHACLRFFNSCLLYTEHQLHLLEHVLRPVPCKQREDFFLAVRRCRRRRQHPKAYDEAAVSRLFSSSPVDAAVVAMRAALVVCLRQKLRRRCFSASDVYRAFDVLRRGALTAPQLLAGLAWLGIEKQELLQEKQRQLLQVFDLDGDGLVSEEDFLAVVGDVATDTYTAPDLRPAEPFPEAHAAAAAAVVVAGEAARGSDSAASSFRLPSSYPAGPPAAAAPSGSAGEARSIRAPAPPFSAGVFGAAGGPGDAAAAVGVTEEEKPSARALLWRRLGVRSFEPDDEFFTKLKFKLQPHKVFKKVWEGRMLQVHRDTPSPATTHTPATSTVSIWVAEQLDSRHRGLMRRNRERVAFGCFACRGGDIHKATAAAYERYGDAAAAAGSSGTCAESDVPAKGSNDGGAAGELPKHHAARGRSRRSGEGAGEPGDDSGVANVSGVLPQVLEIIDSSSSVMSESGLLRQFIDTFFPLPSQYRVFWRGQTPSLASLAGCGRSSSAAAGGQPATGVSMLTLWIGVPPSSYFTCLGLTATVGSRDATPSPGALRCVPRAWVRPTCVQPFLLGDGLFAGGGTYPLLRAQQEHHGSRAAGTLSLWSVGEMGLLGASVGGGKTTYSAATPGSRGLNAGEDAEAAAAAAEKQTPSRRAGGQQAVHAPITGGVLWGDFVAPAFRLEKTRKAAAAAGLQNSASSCLRTAEARQQAAQPALDLLTENADDSREAAAAAALIPRLIPKPYT